MPGDENYEGARSVWNGAIDRRPAVIARCSSAEEVATAIRFARESNLEISVRGGGHNYSGNAVCDAGLMIHLGGMNSVAADAVGRLAVCGGGTTWAEVDAATQQHGLAVPGGFISHTGIGGLTLGGGIGWLTKLAGLSCDNLVGVEVVTADSRILHASADEHPELFWAVRGGGGNFGVVTSFEFALHDVGPMVNLGLFFWGLDVGTEALRLSRDFLPSLPADATGFIGVCLSAPPAPFVPEQYQVRMLVGGCPGARCLGNPMLWWWGWASMSVVVRTPPAHLSDTPMTESRGRHSSESPQLSERFVRSAAHRFPPQSAHLYRSILRRFAGGRIPDLGSLKEAAAGLGADGLAALRSGARGYRLVTRARRPAPAIHPEELNMSEISQLVDAHYAAVNKGDVEGAAAVMTDDIDNFFPGAGKVPGKDGFRIFTTPFFKAFPDARIRVLGQVESGDTIMTEGVYSGTHSGVLATPQGEVPPTGKTIDLHFCDVFQVRDGRAIAHRLYFDNVEFMSQLGLMPSPAARS